jgi:hypothetical protein
MTYIRGEQAEVYGQRRRTERQEVIDIFVARPADRYRVARGQTDFNLMGAAPSRTAGFRQFVRALLSYYPACPRNPGVMVVAQRGRWGYLKFRSEKDFDCYCWWLLQVMAWRSTQGRRSQ